jgi:hypothetical protein
MNQHTATSQQSSPQAIEFVDTLIEQKFAEHKTEITNEVREELRKDLFLRLDNFVIARILEALSEKDLFSFEKLVKEGKSREELRQFAAKHIPDFTNFLTDAFLEFRMVYLSS